jgi:AcrR family transcriptional regulator
MTSRKIALVKKLARPQKLSRAAKQNQIRMALLDAAAKIVGEVGYSAALISTITSQAGVAQGTFYNYFESRQDLFNQLLPSMSNDMLAFIKERASKAISHADREKRSFEAYFAYLTERPEFYRILYESEQFAPEAFQQHVDLIAKNYERTLSRASADGEAREVDPREYEAIAHMLMGMRRYLSRRYVHAQGTIQEIPDFVTRAYMRIVCGGFWFDEELAASEAKDGDRETERSDA